MARPFPAEVNCAVFAGPPAIAIVGSDYQATARYTVATRYQVTQGGQQVWLTQQCDWMRQGTGSVTASGPQASLLVATLQSDLIAAIATAESLTAGDFCVLPDGTVVTL